MPMPDVYRYASHTGSPCMSYFQQPNQKPPNHCMRNRSYMSCSARCDFEVQELHLSKNRAPQRQWFVVSAPSA